MWINTDKYGRQRIAAPTLAPVIQGMIMNNGYQKRRNSLRYCEGDYSCPDGNYYITICIIADIDLTEVGIINIVIETIEYINKMGNAEFLCFVIMPDHIHAIVRLITGEKSLSDIVWSLKTAITKKLKYEGGTLWQRSYFDRIIRNYREFDNIVAYIVDNPTRAGLIKENEEYPYIRIQT